MEQQIIFPVWAIILAVFAAGMFLIIWIPYNRRRTRLLNRFGPQQPSEQQPLEQAKEDPQNAADKAAFLKLLSYLIAIFAIGYLVCFYCFLEPTEITTFILPNCISWLAIMLLPTKWVQKHSGEAFFLALPIGLLASIIPTISYDLPFNSHQTITSVFVCLLALGLKYDPSSPKKLFHVIELPKNKEQELSNWVVLPIMFVMCIVLVFIAWFIIGMAVQNRLFTG